MFSSAPGIFLEIAIGNDAMKPQLQPNENIDAIVIKYTKNHIFWV